MSDLFQWGDEAETRLKVGVGELQPRGDAGVNEGVSPQEPKVYTVAEVAGFVRRYLEGYYPDILVQGELSGGKLYGASGHFYASLKDESGALDVVMFKGQVDRLVATLGSIPPDGTRVVARGKLSTKPGRSQFQLIITTMEPAGLGSLMQQLEALKAKLAAEGLFDVSRKRALPFLPKRIGIITSPRGAVIQDMLHRIAERCPRHVVLWPVAVQGATAADEIAAAVRGFNLLPETQKPDVLIVARGGGSFEDLMAFNTEAVARAVAGSGIPVVSGVGHEPDVSLCDFAADLRAPTPTAAAEYVAPVAAQLLAGLADFSGRLRGGLVALLARRREQLDYLARLIPDPRRAVAAYAEKLESLADRVKAAGERMLSSRFEKLDVLARVLAVVGPEAPLTRGYALVLGPAGNVVSSVQDLAGRVTLKLKDGSKFVEVVE